MKLTELKGIGEKTEKLLNKLSVYTVGDLIRLYPRSFDVCEKPVLISQLSEHADKIAVAIDAVVAKTPKVLRARNLQILSTDLRDEKGDIIKAAWFNMPYLISSLKIGYRYIFRGRIIFKAGNWTMEQPAIHTMDAYAKKMGQMQPIYPLTKGLSNKIVTKAMMQALEIDDLTLEPLPKDILSKHELCDLKFARKNIHFPNDLDDYAKARQRLIFDEFFMFILNVRMMKESNERKENKKIIHNDKRTDTFLGKLPYKLTNAQMNAWNEIKANMEGPRLMNRLIQGDVGSGKTIVSVLSLMNTVFAGYQGAMMVPTEVLAMQQYEDISKLFDEYDVPVKISLLIGSMTAAQKKKERERILSGEVGIIIGTHALIQEKVEYDNLALVITDEQHRFGVHQREMLSKKGNEPHCLVMSATPIPRTLAIILYGDLDISIINELPSNRLPIKNCVVDVGYRPNAYRFMEKQIRQGRQIYVICPMVEANKDGEVMEDERGDSYSETRISAVLENVVDYADKLRQELPSGICVEYLHGKMKPDKKNEIMEGFHDGKINVLVSTTVIEVGVNVPNATVMMIENADRFGLAQLHQLRGRVGRGSYQSYCIFVGTKNAKPENLERLKVLEGSNDGFKIAEEDLKLRGPGDFFGIRQSGDIHFQLADIYQDAGIMKNASEAVNELLRIDPELSMEEHESLRTWLDKWKEEQVVL